ncbi:MULTISPECIES: acyl carrier protein [Catenuloplanes]|uniref:Acyl carrier protein n=1 Tax=Catenuloplanes niger TaxID=587534 RepID=A0AAE4CUD1_9ACTN|nr:acyl carrier protein [Catenuloplanes niger]MDR7324282.1 acyl carrier protein [Catenuloplanes niger]
MPPLDRLREVFRASLELPADAAVDDLEYRGIEKWDSLAHMALVAALEQAFDVMIDTEDVLAISSFAAARKVLERQGVDFD